MKLKNKEFKGYDVFFELSGSIDLNEGVDYADILMKLIQEEKYKNITQEIEGEIWEKLHQKAHVEIEFHNGSIVVTGLIVMNFLGLVSGTVSFFEYAGKFIKLIVERVLRERVRAVSDMNPVVLIDVTTNSYLKDAATNHMLNQESSKVFDISASKLLIYITLINIFFFVGGTLFNLFQVDSIQKRYSDANEKFAEVQTKYDSANNLAKYARVKYEDQLNSIVQDIMTKKLAIISSLSSDTIKISQDIAIINSKLLALNGSIEKLSHNIKANDKLANQIGEKIQFLQKNKVKFGMRDIWEFMSTWPRIYFILLVLISICAIIISIRKRPRFGFML